ncbi:hypothetical protein Pint_30538 [Pistacia integerrima]|uniref:Uncharacterized protein n=1 Tax=Pistacia integerrima TaxID=434235 RepID=A0ACC0X200_9ROSI|nr:hypothetical protein Pint_30538 [Pistacia integerrima]
MANNDSNDEDGKNTGDLGVSANIDQSKVVNYISLYYLHPFDHPGLIFVTNPLSESGDHYFTWSGSFMNAFHSKNKDLNLIPVCKCGCTCGMAKKIVDPLPKLRRAYAIAVQEEKQRAIVTNHTPLIEATALLTKGSESQPKKNGIPSANVAATNFSSKMEDEWVIDTRATNHITYNIDSLSDAINWPNIPPVQIPNGETTAVHALGQIALGKRLTLETYHRGC